MKPTEQNFQRLIIHDGMLAEQAGDYNTSLKFYNMVFVADPNSKTSDFIVQHRRELMRKMGQLD
jgi:hypothetical protein